jgi:hypothetical protein
MRTSGLKLQMAMAVPLLAALCGCQNPHVYTDVSGDPRYNPGGIVGRCFYLREGAYVLKAENQRPRENTYQRLVAGEGQLYPPMSEFESGSWDHGRYRGAKDIVGFVPAGTLVCIQKIVRDESLKDKPVQGVAAILDRRFMNDVLVSRALVHGPDPMAHWTAASAFLAPCEKNVPATQPAGTIRRKGF